MNVQILKLRLLTMTMAALCCLSSARAEVRYNISPVGPYNDPNLGYIRATGINNQGDVVGNYNGFFSPGGSAGSYLWTDGGGFQPIPLPFPTSNLLLTGGVNDTRSMAIFQSGSLGTLYQYSPVSGYQPIGLTENPRDYELPGRRLPQINNAGQISATMEVVHSGNQVLEHAMRYTPGVGFQDLGLLNGSATWANGINKQGWIVGGSKSGGGVEQAFVWQGDALIPLGMREAFAINDAGTVLGVTDSLQPVVLRDGNFIPINFSGTSAKAFGLNSSGQVVGFVEQPTLSAFIWTEAEGTLDLNTLVAPGNGWTLGLAYGINESGQILGLGLYGGNPRVFRLDPVPEPGTWALFGLGSICGWFVLRKRK